jgi:hypothetical protein
MAGSQADHNQVEDHDSDQLQLAGPPDRLAAVGGRQLAVDGSELFGFGQPQRGCQ